MLSASPKDRNALFGSVDRDPGRMEQGCSYLFNLFQHNGRRPSLSRLLRLVVWKVEMIKLSTLQTKATGEASLFLYTVAPLLFGQHFTLRHH